VADSTARTGEMASADVSPRPQERKRNPLSFIRRLARLHTSSKASRRPVPPKSEEPLSRHTTTVSTVSSRSAPSPSILSTTYTGTSNTLPSESHNASLHLPSSVGGGGGGGGGSSSGPMTDNASIITLASSSKRISRRRSLDTDASVRALAPSSIFNIYKTNGGGGGSSSNHNDSRESLQGGLNGGLGSSFVGSPGSSFKGSSARSLKDGDRMRRAGSVGGASSLWTFEGGDEHDTVD